MSNGLGRQPARLRRQQPDKWIIAIKQPIGVVAAITPWNFPTPC
ncbi:aldehyde dehydrogenase family protein [Rhizobium leguminosarum]|nr:aldehyde dehydrogenase family protein [Rhizobium leguminosarum]